MANEKLIATCGTYCGACEMYRAAKDKNQAKIDAMMKDFSSMGLNIKPETIDCDGCLAGGKLTPWCQECKMKKCAKEKGENGICSPTCPDFPCETLSKFSEDALTHHHEVLDNLRRLHEVGLKKHAEQEEKRWQCPKCKQPLAWYDRACPKCGEKRPDKLFKVEYDWSVKRYS
jgi:hypothetical protein